VLLLREVHAAEEGLEAGVGAGRPKSADRPKRRLWSFFLIPSQDCVSRLEYVVDELGSSTEGRDFSYGRRHEFSAANREEE